MLVKKNNKAVFEIAVVDNGGELITDLATASAIKFQVKATKDGVAIINKSIGNGIEVDIPNTGYIRLTFLPADTLDIEVSKYFMALQIEYSITNIQEIDLKNEGEENVIDRMSIIQDIIQPIVP